MFTVENPEYEWPIMKVIYCALGLSVIFISCSLLNHKLGLKDDNLLEEATEELIKEQTSIEIDLSPSSPECHKKK